MKITKWKPEDYDRVKACWDSIAKPLDSMGRFETEIARIGAIQETVLPKLEKTAVLVLCADNGVVEEGISQSPQEVTRLCAENIAAGKTVVGILAKSCGCEVMAVDMGVNTAEMLKGVLDRKVRAGTRNFAKEPAMTLSEARQAIQIGIELVREKKEEGYDLLAVGEMGIGNTTTSSAVTAALLGCTARETAGRGAGLDDDGLARKIAVIDESIDRYQLAEKEPIEILAAVGGYDIAGMVGVYVGGAIYHIPIVIDGMIGMAAALLAERMYPGVKDFLIPSHKSREPAAEYICRKLQLTPVLDAGMALGEGTGAVMMIGLLQAALKVYRESVPFAASGVEQYTRFS